MDDVNILKSEKWVCYLATTIGKNIKRYSFHRKEYHVSDDIRKHRIHIFMIEEASSLKRYFDLNGTHSISEVSSSFFHDNCLLLSIEIAVIVYKEQILIFKRCKNTLSLFIKVSSFYYKIKKAEGDLDELLNRIFLISQLKDV